MNLFSTLFARYYLDLFYFFIRTMYFVFSLLVIGASQSAEPIKSSIFECFTPLKWQSSDVCRVEFAVARTTAVGIFRTFTT